MTGIVFCFDRGAGKFHLLTINLAKWMLELTPDITVIIPDYSGARLLENNLPSVIGAASRYCKNTVRIIVVDDGSSDNSVELVAEIFPEVDVVIHQNDQGFSAAIASGVRTSTTEMLFLLNSDVEIFDDIFAPLVGYFQDAATFSVSPLIRNELGEVSRRSLNRLRMLQGRLKIVPWSLDDALEQRKTSKLYTLYSSGGSMLVRKSMLLEIGCFDPIFKPFYGEDFWSRSACLESGLGELF